MSARTPWLSASQLRELCERRGIRCDVALAQERNDYSNFEERMARSLSWLARAEEFGADAERADDRLVFCWIAFNSLYAGHVGQDASARAQRSGLDFFSERRHWLAFLDWVIQGVRRAPFAAAFDVLRAPVMALVNNPYVLHRFWQSTARPGGWDWREEFDQDRRGVIRFYAERMRRDARPAPGERERPRGDPGSQLEGFVARCVLDRVYVLRNQIIHGAAGYRDGYNRDQVRVGAALMQPLLCVLAQAIVDHADAEPAVAFGAVDSPPQGERPDTPVAYPSALSD